MMSQEKLASGVDVALSCSVSDMTEGSEMAWQKCQALYTKCQTRENLIPPEQIMISTASIVPRANTKICSSEWRFALAVIGHHSMKLTSFLYDTGLICSSYNDKL